MQLPATELQRVALLAAAQRLVVFTGAGVSKESGLATFRDSDGVWQKIDPQKYATPEGFKRHPRKVWQWYQARRQKVKGVQPNPAHRAIAELDEILPHVVVITQNIDGLHQAAGSEEVLELHGTLRRYKCFANCRGTPTPVPTPGPEVEEPARCPHCGAYVRPDVVWFNEMLPVDVWEEAALEVTSCDAMLIVGTSGIVAPAASLPHHAEANGAFIVEVNPEPTALTPLTDVSLRGPAGEVVPRVVARVREARARLAAEG
jgi:NAD-dependent deacetylase